MPQRFSITATQMLRASAVLVLKIIPSFFMLTFMGVIFGALPTEIFIAFLGTQDTCFRDELTFLKLGLLTGGMLHLLARHTQRQKMPQDVTLLDEDASIIWLVMSLGILAPDRTLDRFNYPYYAGAGALALEATNLMCHLYKNRGQQMFSPDPDARIDDLAARNRLPVPTCPAGRSNVSNLRRVNLRPS